MRGGLGRVRRGAWLGAIGRALLALIAAPLFAPASAPATSLPPDLVALEQQMAQLQVNSERFSFQEEFAFGGFLGQEIPFALIVAGAGEASDSPPAASMAGGLLGEPAEQMRVIGNTVYRYRHQAAEIDGGRPWVSSPRTATQEAVSVDPGGILASDQAGQQGTFSKLIEELNGA